MNDELVIKNVCVSIETLVSKMFYHNFKQTNTNIRLITFSVTDIKYVWSFQLKLRIIALYQHRLFHWYIWQVDANANVCDVAMMKKKKLKVTMTTMHFYQFVSIL